MRKTFAALAAVALAGGLALVGAQSASAHTPNAALSCTTATVSLTSYDKGATAFVAIDGETVHEGTFNGNYKLNQALTGNKEHTLKVNVVSKDGNRYNFNFDQTTTNCYVAPPLTKVSIVPPTQTPPTCTVGSTYTVPALPAGLKYTDGTIAGNDPKFVRKAPGTYDLGAGETVSIQEHSIAGYEPVSQDWTFTGADATGYQNTASGEDCYIAPQPPKVEKLDDVIGKANCNTQTYTITHREQTITYTFDAKTGTYTASEPVVTVTGTDVGKPTTKQCPLPPVVTPPTDTPTPPVVVPPIKHGNPPVVTHTAPKPVAHVAAVAPTAKPKALAFTGSEHTGVEAGIGGLLLAAGIAAVLVNRRRKSAK